MVLRTLSGNDINSAYFISYLKLIYEELLFFPLWITKYNGKQYLPRQQKSQ